MAEKKSGSMKRKWVSNTVGVVAHQTRELAAIAEAIAKQSQSEIEQSQSEIAKRQKRIDDLTQQLQQRPHESAVLEAKELIERQARELKSREDKIKQLQEEQAYPVDNPESYPESIQTLWTQNLELDDAHFKLLELYVYNSLLETGFDWPFDFNEFKKDPFFKSAQRICELAKLNPSLKESCTQNREAIQAALISLHEGQEKAITAALPAWFERKAKK